jgi:hypothetical protein
MDGATEDRTDMVPDRSDDPIDDDAFDDDDESGA